LINMKRIALTLALTLIVATAAVAAPQHRGAGPGGPGAPGGPGSPQQGMQAGHARGGEILPPALLAEFLGLTEAQIASIQTLRESQRATIQPLVEQQRANREQIRAAVEAGDAAKAGALLVANHQIAQQIKAARDAFRTSVEALLTAEQKAKFAIYQEIQELRRSRGPRHED
jgi:Spy/CpxP family protein refolding chaperone